MSGEQQIRVLNEEYIKASLAGDVEWYRFHLAEEFVCIESDGSVLNKAAFLQMTAQGSDLAVYTLDQVNVRIYGSVALVAATGRWTTKTGTEGMSRYVDVYVNHGEAGWKAVSAQVTRPSKPLSAASER